MWSGGFARWSYLSGRGKTVERLASRNLPLAILSNQSFKSRSRALCVGAGDRVLLWSDGIQEARNTDGVMFGEERLNALLEQELDNVHILMTYYKRFSTT